MTSATRSPGTTLAAAQSPAHALLETHFGFREFLEGQEAAIQAILNEEDVLVVMPTGGGKSLCYQLPAMMLQGITVVVSPLIALMKDQVDGLVEKKIPATFINSSLADRELHDRLERMAKGEFRLVYVAPERFKSSRFIEMLAPLSIALFAIDEAHCISQWGHDFRPDYLRLRHVIEELGRPPVAALTATATPEVRLDIIEQLALGQGGRKAPSVFVSGFARQNLTLAVAHVRSKAEKMDRICRTVSELKTGIVYCATRKNVESVSAELSARGIKCVTYHGGMPDDRRSKEQEKFMSGSCPVAVATNAFGMGVDRADLRFVMHFDIPGSVEAYYQEAGRAGRDGEPSRCELLFNYADVRTQEFFIEGANPSREIVEDLYRTLMELCRKGPIEMAISEIAGHVFSATNEMAVGSGLHLLARAGFINRVYVQGSRKYTTHLASPVVPLEDLDIDFEKLDVKLKRDLAKLHRIISYADHQQCRHKFILDYFGDTTAEPRCNVCDNCLARSRTGARLPTEEETVIVQKALSCVGRMNGKFGRGRITQALVGSRSKEVLDAGLDRLSTYGILAAEGADYVWSLINALVNAGCLAVSAGKYPTLSMTPLGIEVVHRRKTIPLELPARIRARPAPARKARAKSRTTAPVAEGSVDQRIFDALKEWRRRKASSMGGVPAFVIYPDSTLVELACHAPKTEAELLMVRGIGPAKVKRFGAETLQVIRASR